VRVGGRVRIGSFIGVAAVVAGCLAGCESSEGLPILADPHEVVTAAAAATAALGTVHVQIDLAGRNNDGAGGEQIRYVLEADIDVQGRNVAGRSQLTRGDNQANETSEFVFVGGTIFSRDGANPRWTANDDAGNGDHLPANGAYLTMIEKAIANGSAVLTMSDAVPCGSATCYHVTAALSREASWALLVAPVVGQAQAGVGDLPPPEMVPAPATVDVFVEQKTRSLVALSGTFTVQGAVITFSVTFSNHDLPIRIAAPPPQLVDNLNGGFRIDPPRAVPAESPAP
jgi:hypothetical protein